jgi:hypothetical protein
MGNSARSSGAAEPLFWTATCAPGSSTFRPSNRSSRVILSRGPGGAERSNDQNTTSATRFGEGLDACRPQRASVLERAMCGAVQQEAPNRAPRMRRDVIPRPSDGLPG